MVYDVSYATLLQTHLTFFLLAVGEMQSSVISDDAVVPNQEENILPSVGEMEATGTEQLRNLDRLFIAERSYGSDSLKVATSSSMSEVFDKHGQILYLVDNFTKRCCFGMSFNIDVHQNEYNEVLNVSSSSKYCFGNLVLSSSEVTITNSRKNKITGYVVRKFTCFGSTYAILDGEKNKIFLIRGPSTFGRSSNEIFHMTAVKGGRKIGSIGRKFVGKVFAYTGNFNFIAMGMQKDLAVEHKELLLAFLVYLYEKYFNGDSDDKCAESKHVPENMGKERVTAT